MDLCQKHKVKVKTKHKVISIEAPDDGSGGYSIKVQEGENLQADVLFIGAGSSNSLWTIIERLGHQIVAPVPSLFTFRIQDERLEGLAGISVQHVRVRVPDIGLESEGPMLITHKGLSGPAILKMSAWGALELYEVNYSFVIEVDLLPTISSDDLASRLKIHGGKSIFHHQITNLPKRLHRSLVSDQSFSHEVCGHLHENEVLAYIDCFKKVQLQVLGQNRFKEEFVTAGGIELKEVDFRSFSSKLLPNCYLCGEVLNIDGVTGGFNFQACWTGATIAARHVARTMSEANN